MANTPEGKVKDVVKRILKDYGVYYFMPVQNGMGKPGLDFHCIFEGVGFCIETKAPGKKPTARQRLTIKEIEAAGGKCFVIDNVTLEATGNLREWLAMVHLATRAGSDSDEH
jgi:hypothetical protein